MGVTISLEYFKLAKVKKTRNIYPAFFVFLKVKIRL